VTSDSKETVPKDVLHLLQIPQISEIKNKMETEKKDYEVIFEINVLLDGLN